MGKSYLEKLKSTFIKQMMLQRGWASSWSSMEYNSAEVHHDKDGKSTRIDANELSNVKVEDRDIANSNPVSQINSKQVGFFDQKGGGIVSQAAPHGEVNIEAMITPEDVIRAGGFGARDDINSFLPVASDSTDFEASIRVAQDYEQPQEKVRRPGLGWTEGLESV